MFREGYYLEVIKTNDNCAATAVVNVEEKIVEVNEKCVSTNKWLNLEDWAAIYDVLQRALIRNNQKLKSTNQNRCDLQTFQRRKFTRQLQVTYTFEVAEESNKRTILPTIRANIAPIKQESQSKRRNEKLGLKRKKSDVPEIAKNMDTASKSTKAVKDATKFKKKKPSELSERKKKLHLFEEYVPDGSQKLSNDLNYVPSKKNILESIKFSNEYTPTVKTDLSVDTNNVEYIPNGSNNSSSTNNMSLEPYEPLSTSSTNHSSKELYIPNSRATNFVVEEYQPDFTSKSMKFDDSYVPSTVDKKKTKSNKEKNVSRRTSKSSTRERKSSKSCDKKKREI